MDKKLKKFIINKKQKLGRKYVEVKEIGITEVLEIRREVMWPDKEIDFVRVEGDQDALHLGLVVEGKTVSIISLFIEGDRLQFRKFATRKDEQGKGYGTFLLNHVIELSKKRRINYIWCNAREEKTNFYEKFGLKVTKKKFIKSGKSYVIMEKNNKN